MAFCSTTDMLSSKLYTEDSKIAQTFVICTEKIMALPQIPPEVLEIIFGMNDMVFTNGQAIQYYERLYPRHNIKWEDLDYSPLEIYRKAREISYQRNFSIRYIQELLLGIYEFGTNVSYDMEIHIVCTPLKKVRALIQSGRYNTANQPKTRGHVFSTFFSEVLLRGLLIRRADEDFFGYLRKIYMEYHDVYNTLKYILYTKRFDLIEPFYRHLLGLVNRNLLSIEETAFVGNAKHIKEVEQLERVYIAYLSIFTIEDLDELHYQILFFMISSVRDRDDASRNGLLIVVMKWLYEKGYRPTTDTYQKIIEGLSNRTFNMHNKNMCKQNFEKIFINRT